MTHPRGDRIVVPALSESLPPSAVLPTQTESIVSSSIGPRPPANRPELCLNKPREIPRSLPVRDKEEKKERGAEESMTGGGTMPEEAKC